MGTLALLLWGWAGLLVASGLALWALIKLPKPVPARWEVRLFLLMGMPADQYLAFIIKVRRFQLSCWMGGCTRWRRH